MTGRVVLTLAVFAATLLAMLLRPRGLHEAWAAICGGALMLALGLETPGQARRTVTQGSDVLLFLLALMALSILLERAGFFEWAALHTARSARGSGPRLFRNVFWLGAACTVLLSLDTTAIILTPLVLAFVRHLRLSARPYLLTCAFVANTGSLLLPVSNLTNLLYASALHLPFAGFVLRMWLPQAVALLANEVLLRWLFRRELAAGFDADLLPSPRSVLPDLPFFYGAVAVLGMVLVGYFAGALLGVAPYVVATVGAVALLLWGIVRRQVRLSMAGEISWSLFPFVIGLFVVVRAVENLGVAMAAARMLGLVGGQGLLQALATAFSAGVGTNVVNNIPMALVSLEVLQRGQASSFAVYGSLLGCNLGPNLTLVGSLATMLVISSARKHGEDVGARDFMRVGVIITPLLLALSAFALWVGLRVLAPG